MKRIQNVACRHIITKCQIWAYIWKKKTTKKKKKKKKKKEYAWNMIRDRKHEVSHMIIQQCKAIYYLFYDQQ